MKKKVLWSIPVVIAMIIVITLPLVWLGYSAVRMFSRDLQKVNVRMFEHIEELEKLEPYVTKELTIGDDRYVRNLDIVDSYLCKVEYNDCTYEVYAYVFKDMDTSKKYFRNIQGGTTEDNASYSASTDWLSYTEYVAYRYNCAILVNGKGYDSCVEFINWLNADFSKGLFE